MIQDHFERHCHHAGVVDWNFNIVFDSQDEVMDMANFYRPLLTRAEFYEPIPNEWLHGTILRVGTIEEYSESEMRSVARKVRDHLHDVSLPQFTFGAPMIINGNVCFKIIPEKALEQLYDIVITSLEEVVGADRTTKSPYGNFLAHTSLAYRKSQYDETELLDLLNNAAIKSATFKIGRMPLIKQKPVDGHYEWDIIEDITI